MINPVNRQYSEEYNIFQSTFLFPANVDLSCSAESCEGGSKIT